MTNIINLVYNLINCFDFSEKLLRDYISNFNQEYYLYHLLQYQPCFKVIFLLRLS